jgi:hypothetical protein
MKRNFDDMQLASFTAARAGVTPAAISRSVGRHEVRLGFAVR